MQEGLASEITMMPGGEGSGGRVPFLFALVPIMKCCAISHCLELNKVKINKRVAMEDLRCSTSNKFMVTKR